MSSEKKMITILIERDDKEIIKREVSTYLFGGVLQGIAERHVYQTSILGNLQPRYVHVGLAQLIMDISNPHFSQERKWSVTNKLQFINSLLTDIENHTLNKMNDPLYTGELKTADNAVHIRIWDEKGSILDEFVDGYTLVTITEEDDSTLSLNRSYIGEQMTNENVLTSLAYMVKLLADMKLRNAQNPGKLERMVAISNILIEVKEEILGMLYRDTRKEFDTEDEHCE